MGERFAVRFLRRSGYKILVRNFSCFLGEIDIVARKGGILSFVEVKTRRSTKFGMPAEAVNKRKKEKLTELAWFYLTKHNLLNVPCRFEVVSVTIKKDRWPRKIKVDLIRDAF